MNVLLKYIFALLITLPLTTFAAQHETKEIKAKAALSAEQQAAANQALLNAVYALFNLPVTFVPTASPDIFVDIVDPVFINPRLLQVKTALQQGGDIITLDTIAPGEEGDTLLHTIFYVMPHQPQRMTLLIKLLLDQHAIHARELNVPNKGGDTPFMWAMYYMPRSIIERFIKLGADVNAGDKKSNVPLTAVINRTIEAVSEREYTINALVQLLLKAGAQVDGVPYKRRKVCPECGLIHRYRPLYEAVVLQYPKVTETLLKAGATIFGDILPLAADLNNTELVRLLLRYKAPVNGTDHGVLDERRSALMYAAIRGNLVMAEMLFKAGAQVNMADKNGVTPLIFAAWNGHVPMVDWLLQQGADINQCDARGKSALTSAAQKGYYPVVERLLVHGADPSLVDNDGYDAYWYAKYRAPAGATSEAIQAMLQRYKEEVHKGAAVTDINHELFQNQYLKQSLWKEIAEYYGEPVDTKELDTSSLLHDEGDEE